MRFQNFIFIRESFDMATLEKDRAVYQGKLLDAELNKLYSFVFKIENEIVRMIISVENQVVTIREKYKNEEVIIILEEKKHREYQLKLNSIHTFTLITEASLIKVDDFSLEMKYNLIDKVNGQVISFHEIHIAGEN